jgi:hypothetical protein
MNSKYRRGFKTWCETVSAQQRKLLCLDSADPLNPWKLAEYHGILVWNADQVPGVEPRFLRILTKVDPDSWSAITLQMGAKHLIVLNPSHRGGRPASNLSHELSHTLIGHEPGRVDVSPDGLLLLHTYSRQQEDEANWLSGCLLLPREALLHIARSDMSRAEMLDLYGVSEPMLRFRFNVSGVARQMERRAKSSKRRSST